jgi:hypothetical protein
MMQAASKAQYFSETSVNFQRTTRHYIPEGRTFDNHSSEIFKSDQFSIVFKIARQFYALIMMHVLKSVGQ